MLYREIIAVCSEIHTKHINTLCGQNVELLNVKVAFSQLFHKTWRDTFPEVTEHSKHVTVKNDQAQGRNQWPAVLSKLVDIGF
jgi:hypothetical protein